MTDTIRRDLFDLATSIELARLAVEGAISEGAELGPLGAVSAHLADLHDKAMGAADAVDGLNREVSSS